MDDKNMIQGDQEPKAFSDMTAEELAAWHKAEFALWNGYSVEDLERRENWEHTVEPMVALADEFMGVFGLSRVEGEAEASVRLDGETHSCAHCQDGSICPACMGREMSEGLRNAILDVSTPLPLDELMEDLGLGRMPVPPPLIKWTHFHDCGSGGREKTRYSDIYIEASREEAIRLFARKFLRNPLNVTCAHCGDDYHIEEAESLEQASGFYRGCDYDETTDRWLEKPAESYRSGLSYKSLAEYIEIGHCFVLTAEKAAELKNEKGLPELTAEEARVLEWFVDNERFDCWVHKHSFPADLWDTTILDGLVKKGYLTSVAYDSLPEHLWGYWLYGRVYEALVFQSRYPELAKRDSPLA